MSERAPTRAEYEDEYKEIDPDMSDDYNPFLIGVRAAWPYGNGQFHPYSAAKCYPVVTRFWSNEVKELDRLRELSRMRDAVKEPPEKGSSAVLVKVWDGWWLHTSAHFTSVGPWALGFEAEHVANDGERVIGWWPLPESEDER